MSPSPLPKSSLKSKESISQTGKAPATCRAAGLHTGRDEEEMASADLSSETSGPQGHAAPHSAGVRTAQHPRAPVSLLGA